MAEIKNQFSLAAESLSGFTSLKKTLVLSVFLDCPLPRPAAALLLLSPGKVQQVGDVPEQSCLSGETAQCSELRGGIYAQPMYCRKGLRSKGPWLVPTYVLCHRCFLVPF